MSFSEYIFWTALTHTFFHSLANSEMRVILCRLVYNFDFELVDKEFAWLDQKVYKSRIKDALMVKITEAQR